MVQKVRNISVGLFLCTFLAGLTAWGFDGHPYRTAVPLGFILVVTAVALLLGAAAALAGLMATAAVLAFFLFKPVGSFWIESEVAQQNLAWMLMFGLISGFLFARAPATHRPPRDSENQEHQ